MISLALHSTVLSSLPSDEVTSLLSAWPNILYPPAAVDLKAAMNNLSIWEEST